MKTVLLTGAAGFIGSWTAHSLIKRGDRVIGVDNFNDYYDVKLKRDRVKNFKGQVEIVEADVSDLKSIERLFQKNKIDQVCHLAAQAGVGYSLKNPFAYETANNLGTLNLLELCRQNGVSSFIYASSSSVYGGNKKTPFSVTDPVDKPISLYAATKRYNELMAYTYHHLFGMHCTGLRFFTVYGPWGRPDMALFKFTKAILEGTSIDVFNHGKMKRDFTYVTDIVSGILASLDKNYPYEIFNIGNAESVDLMHFIACLEKELKRPATKNFLDLQPGDLPETVADISKAQRMLGYKPTTKIEHGVHAFVEWFKSYYKVR
jgi:UDP-glucuronate 4-epimerase